MASYQDITGELNQNRANIDQNKQDCIYILDRFADAMAAELGIHRDQTLEVQGKPERVLSFTRKNYFEKSGKEYCPLPMAVQTGLGKECHVDMEIILGRPGGGRHMVKYISLKASIYAGRATVDCDKKSKSISWPLNEGEPTPQLDVLAKEVTNAVIAELRSGSRSMREVNEKAEPNPVGNRSRH